MPLKKSQRSLKAWTKQNGELKVASHRHRVQKQPGRDIYRQSPFKSLSPQEYAATTRAKRKATKAGKQFSKQPKKIRAKVKPHRKVK